MENWIIGVICSAVIAPFVGWAVTLIWRYAKKKYIERRTFVEKIKKCIDWIDAVAQKETLQQAAEKISDISDKINRKKYMVVYNLPEVKAIDRSDGLRFVVEKNEWYVQGAFVSIYHQQPDNEIENLLGIGFVETINAQGNIQIVFTEQNNKFKDLINRLQNNKNDCKAIKIKPAITKEMLSWVVK